MDLLGMFALVPGMDAQILDILKGMNFPANKHEIINKARDKGAATNFISFLEQMTDTKYFSLRDAYGEATKIYRPTVMQILSDKNFPASKQDIIKKAKESGANENFISFLEKVVDRNYGSSQDVQNEAMKIAEGKYGKLIMTDIKRKSNHPEGMIDVQVSLEHGNPDWPKNTLGGNWEICNRAWCMAARSHVHEFDEWLVFLNADMTKPFDFDAEIEICIGEELEMHVITQSSIVYLPKGLRHCPLNLKRVGHPVLFEKIYFTPDSLYDREIKAIKAEDLRKLGL